MAMELPRRDTPLAEVRYTAADRVEVHFKPDITLTVAGVQTMMAARQELGGSGPHKVLMLLPDYVDFDMAMITTDHYEAVPQPNTLAVAWVARTERNATFARMYLAYFPPPMPSEVFLTEAEARAWLGW